MTFELFRLSLTVENIKNATNEFNMDVIDVKGAYGTKKLLVGVVSHLTLKRRGTKVRILSTFIRRSKNYSPFKSRREKPSTKLKKKSGLMNYRCVPIYSFILTQSHILKKGS